MQIWYPGPDVRDNGDYRVTFNKGNEHPFAIITLSEDGHTALVVQSPAEADALIKAAVEAKRLLSPPVMTCSERTCDARHPQTGDWCVTEGAHAEHSDTYGQTWPAGQGGVLFPAGDEDERCADEYLISGTTYYVCSLNDGHPGLHSHLTPTGAFIAEWGYEDGHVHTTAETPASVSA